jgi:imidazolonepropionase-like amidohydrolase
MTQADSCGHDNLAKGALVELINARFVDVNNGCFFGRGTRMVIQGNRIAAMPEGPEKTNTQSPDITIDLKGKTVLPGLCNVHCHIQMINPTLLVDLKTIKAKRRLQAQQVDKAMADCIERGITHIRDAFSDDLLLNSDLKERIDRGSIAGPRIQQAVMVGPLGGYLIPNLKGARKIFLGFMGVGKIKYSENRSGAIAFALDADAQTIRDAVNQAIDERGADLIKVGESLEEGLLNKNPVTLSMHQLETITDQARKRGLQTTIHSVSVETFQRAVKAGFSSLAHMARDNELSRDDIDACLSSGTFIDPTLSVGYDLSWRLAGNAFSNDPNMETLYQFRNSRIEALAHEFWVPELADCVVRGFKKANAENYKALGFIDMSKQLAHFSRLVRFGIHNTQQLFDAGVTLACGNDGGIQSCTPAMVGHELAILELFMNPAGRKKSFDGAAAVKAATINSARSMGIDNQFGSLETGKLADLVVVDGNPLEDISVIGKKVDALFMDGQLKINKCGLVPVEGSRLEPNNSK